MIIKFLDPFNKVKLKKLIDLDIVEDWFDLIDLASKKSNGKISISKQIEVKGGASIDKFCMVGLISVEHIDKFIEIEHLYLTKEQYNKLCVDFNKMVVDEKIKYIKTYDKKSKYKDMYRCIRNWLSKDSVMNKEWETFTKKSFEAYVENTGVDVNEDMYKEYRKIMSRYFNQNIPIEEIRGYIKRQINYQGEREPQFVVRPHNMIKNFK